MIMTTMTIPLRTTMTIPLRTMITIPLRTMATYIDDNDDNTFEDNGNIH